MLLPFQGADIRGCACTQGVASLALGCGLAGLSPRSRLMEWRAASLVLRFPCAAFAPYLTYAPCASRPLAAICRYGLRQACLRKNTPPPMGNVREELNNFAQYYTQFCNTRAHIPAWRLRTRTARGDRDAASLACGETRKDAGKREKRKRREARKERP